MAVGTRMQQRRGLESEWTASDYVLAEGEIGIATDTGAVKFGDGVNGWSALPIALEGQYLPLLGTATDSELLGGISANSFMKVADSSVTATADKYVKRTSDGGVKGTDATENDELTSLQQMNAAITDSRKFLITRTVTANTTLVLGDTSKMVLANNSSLTTQLIVTVPENVTAAFPVGSFIDIVSVGVGAVKIVPANTGTMAIYGKVNIMPGYGSIRLVKINPNEWMGMEVAKGTRLPRIKVNVSAAGQSFATTTFVQYDAIVAADSFNPDNEWFSIPASGLATARRIICNKDGEYEFNANISFNGGSIAWGSVWRMTADNSSTGGESKGVQTIQATGSVTLTRRVVAGQSFGVRITAGSGNSGRADLEYSSGGDPVSFIITRIGD